MTAVSCRVTEWILDLLSSEGLSPERWIRNLPITEERLRDSDQHLEWDLFAELCDRLDAGEFFESREALLEATRRFLSERFAREGRRLGGRFNEAGQLFWLADRWLGPALFPTLVGKLEERSADQLELHFATPPDQRPCPVLFALIEQALACLPAWLGQPPARVTADCAQREAVFTISLAGSAAADGRSELALRESEARYRIFSELASDYCYAVRIDSDLSMTFEWVAGAWSRITGYHNGEIGVENWKSLMHPEDLEACAQAYGRFLETGGGVHEYRIVTKSGETRWLREHSRVTQTADGSMFWYGSCRDITDQKSAERAQNISELRYRAIVEHSDDVIVEFGADGQVFYVSPNVLELIGYGPDEVAEFGHADAIHPEDLSIVVERFAKVVQTGNSERTTVRVRHRDGRWHWVDVTATAFLTAEGDTRALAIARDITERLQAEQAQRRMASVVGNSSEFIAMFSVEGRILFMNDAGRRLVGIENEGSALAKTVFDCMAPEEAQNLRLRVFPDVLGSGQWIGDFQLRHFQTGQDIACLANVFLVSQAEPDGEQEMAIVARDITARKNAEMALRESEERYRTLVENAYDLVAELDEERCFVYVSQNYQALLGYKSEELLGRQIEELLHPEDHFVPAEARDGREEATAPSLERIFETEETPSHRFQHKDGTWRWLESHARKMKPRDGETLTVVTSRDITARRRAEEALRESREQLIQSQKMEAIGRLAGGVAHDFNNLLTAITGNCDLLLEEIGADHPLRVEAHEIMRAADRAGGLTRQLLAFSRRQALQPRVLDLNAVVTDVDRLLRRLIGEDIELITSLESELPRVKVDAGQLEQLIMNLAVNARDAMPRGGQLTIETSTVEVSADGDRSHPRVAPGEYVTLAMRDSGVGMDEETLSRAFEPFFTTKESGKGTGLGLSTAYGMVQQSHGHIRVESALGSGSTFTVYLPRIDEQLAAPDARAVQSELRGGESVLLVEDAAPVRRLVRRFLEKHGYSVIDASSGIEALRASLRHDGVIDLLITDVVLPKMDGRELASRLEQLRPDIKVIFMSGFSDESLSDHGVLSTETALVHKPFTPAALMRKIREVLANPAKSDGADNRK